MNWTEKKVLITGGTGSFGRKFAEILLRDHRPKKLIVFSRDELKQYEMRNHFRDDPTLRFFLGDVRDSARLDRAFDGVDIVIHAAALKQVPTLEYNPFEAVKTNIVGAENVINAAVDRGVSRVIALSSDKAVNPVNLYGATKLCAEKLFIDGNSYAGLKGTRFSIVRYGNVLASRGSVIPLFRERSKTGVLPVTDKRMTRFWITLEQAARFVMHCFEMMLGGEIFVPRIPTMSILDLASVIGPQCKIEIIGIRPGEKLHEVLISSHEARNTVALENFFMIQPEFHWWVRDNIWQKGNPVADNFEYSSDKNDRTLTRQELTEMLEKL
ncbi:MAG: UDP-N-acetylglucosamine 4,6-dehydratase (inverting) [Acidobacteria bacterium]|nr:MAG: UDP-N-acetylglucosamine 4,6-dehydratase (inverting) [Acidobacteriota bacterium]